MASAKRAQVASNIRRIWAFLAIGALGLGALLACSSPTPLVPAQATPAPALAAQRMVIVRGLDEPLLPTRSTSAAEDQAIRQAAAQYQSLATAPHQDDAQVLTPFESFLSQNPDSGWAPSVLTDLGLVYYREGYFSRAFDAFGKAWQKGRTATDRSAKAIVDRAVAELAKMHARVGHLDELDALFREIGDRPMTGPATELLQGARDGAWTMQNDPGVSFLCGPKALKNVLVTLAAPQSALSVVDHARSGSHGFSLQEVAELATRVGLPHRLIHREPGQAVPVPSIINWKTHHYAAINSKDESGRFHIQDPTFGYGTDLVVSQAAIDEEGSGFFLVPQRAPRGAGRSTVKLLSTDAAWRDATADEARTNYGMGAPQQTVDNTTRPQDPKLADGDPKLGDFPPPPSLPSNTGALLPCSHGMCAPSAHLVEVSLNLNDTPVGYAPQVGPPVYSRLTFNQRDALQPSTFTFFNVSPKWALNWLSYIQDDLTAGPATGVKRYISGGGYQAYTGYNATTGSFSGEVETGMVLTRTPASGPLTSYTLSALDGSSLVFAAPDGAVAGLRRVFLSQVVDPQGNPLTFSYDTSLRLVTIADAAGKLTHFCYDPTRADCANYSGDSLLISQISDPFGRSAALDYDGTGRLSSITDAIGITSTFSYDASGVVTALSTPYGTSHFAYALVGCTGTTRCLELTDALGNTERLEYKDTAPLVAFSDPVVPSGIANQNSYLNYRSTYYWDKTAYKKYVTAAAKDYTKAVHYHFMHAPNTNFTGWAIESIQRPLESRIWYNRGGNYSSVESTLPAGDAVSAVARLLDDGSTQLSTATYNTAGKVTSTVDPLGRVTKFSYDSNGVDLLMVQRQVAPGPSPGYVTLARFTYNGQHQPTSFTDAGNNVSHYGYNAQGQLLGAVDAQQHQTNYAYDADGRLKTLSDTNGAGLLGLSYDDFGRVKTRTDSVSGYAVNYEYDALDRPTKATFPDRTFVGFEYKNLDLVRTTDRLGKPTSYEHDANRQLVSTTDAAGLKSSYAYFENGALKSLTDGNNNTTTWDIDSEARPVAKHYPNGAAETLSYETSTGRLKEYTNARGLSTDYAYNKDDSVASISYPNASPPTATVSFQYDPLFLRPVSMTDGLGETDYTYYPILPTATLGAGLLKSIESPVAGSVLATDTVRFNYDALNRATTMAVNGVLRQVQFDAKGRVVSIANPLDTFVYKYIDATSQLASASSTHGPQVAFAYLAPEGDQLLESLTVTGPSNLALSSHGYSYDANQNVIGFSQSYPGQKLALAPLDGPPNDAVPPGVGQAIQDRHTNIPRLWQPTFDAILMLIALSAACAAALSRARRTKRFAQTLVFPCTFGLLVFASCGGDDNHPSSATTAGEAGASAEAGSTDNEPPAGGGHDGVNEGGAAATTGGTGASGSPEAGANEGGSSALPTTQVTAYKYDETNRLLSAAVGTDLSPAPAPQFSYAYDSASNLLEITANAPKQALRYAATNAVANNPYDLDGNPQSLNGKQYTWDAANRLLTIVSGENESDLSYDGQDHLVRIVDLKGGKTIADRAFLWCGAERCAERDNTSTGSPEVKQFFEQGVRFGGENYYYVADALGSVRQLVDSKGAVRAQYDYDPFGNRTKISGDVDSDFGYAGYFNHAESGLEFSLYRAYDPSLGRWLNRDPIGELGGRNLYEYAAANPTSFNDPDGLAVFHIGFPVVIGIRSYEHGWVFDTKGMWGEYTTKGVATPGLSATASYGVLGSLGKDTTGIADYGGPFISASVSVGEGLVGTVGAYIDPHTPTHVGYNFGFGASLPGGPPASVAFTNTVVCTNGSIRASLQRFYQRTRKRVASLLGD